MPYQANFHPILYILFYVIIYIYKVTTSHLRMFVIFEKS